MFENKKFEAFRGLISLAKDGKTFNRIDAKDLEGALKDAKLSNDDKALVALVTATINSDSKYMIEFAQKSDNISSTGQKIMSEKLPKALVEPVVAANGGLPASIISAFGGGGVTTPTKDGSYSLIIEGVDESSATDYYNSGTKSYGSNPAGRASTTGHEIFGHGRSSSLGRTTTQHQDAIRTENLILRVMGMGSVQRDGTNHADNSKVTDPSNLPDF